MSILGKRLYRARFDVKHTVSALRRSRQEDETLAGTEYSAIKS
jgi:hypothetical protein